jgi:hypothetical protein
MRFVMGNYSRKLLRQHVDIEQLCKYEHKRYLIGFQSFYRQIKNFLHRKFIVLAYSLFICSAYSGFVSHHGKISRA